MRRFLVEYLYEITLEDVHNAWEQEEKENMTFEQYLADCLGKNGALTEILTDETPCRRDAVTRYKVHYSEDPADVVEEWLTEAQAREKVWYHDVILEIA